MSKIRLDQVLTDRKLVSSRSQAENYINLGKVKVDGKLIKKSGYFVAKNSAIDILANDQYVSRAALKLAGAAEVMGLDFKGKRVQNLRLITAQKK
jgi:23S rRNA (cytidine1920-2'-O)/16S rRNA (cytidine1409-2'-O)-methyltransferase